MSLSNKPELEEELKEFKSYIENRRALLEDEIEENIHQAIADAKDSLELIRENIDPKVDKIIQNKMELIDNKMENWKKDFRMVAKEEVHVNSDSLLKKTIDELETLVSEKVNSLKDDLKNSVESEFISTVSPRLKKMEENISDFRNKILIALCISGTLLAVVILLKLGE